MSRGSKTSQMSAYQISPKNIHWFSRYFIVFDSYFSLLFGTSAVLTTSFGSNKSAADVARKAVYTTTF